MAGGLYLLRAAAYLESTGEAVHLSRLSGLLAGFCVAAGFGISLEMYLGKRAVISQLRWVRYAVITTIGMFLGLLGLQYTEVLRGHEIAHSYAASAFLLGTTVISARWFYNIGRWRITWFLVLSSVLSLPSTIDIQSYPWLQAGCLLAQCAVTLSFVLQLLALGMRDYNALLNPED